MMTKRASSSKFVLAWIRLAAMLLIGANVSNYATAAEPPIERKLYLPVDQLHLLMAGGNERVLLTQKEYEDLIVKAKPTPGERSPVASVLLNADYAVAIESDRARITGKIELELLDDRLQAIPLDFADVAIEKATLDSTSAAIGVSGDGKFMLFARGRGKHTLSFEAIALVETTTSQQTLRYRLPDAPTSTLRLQSPGNVELKSGAAVIARTIDAATQVTKFELSAKPGPTALVLSLNNRQLREQRVIAVRSATVDQITPTDERLFATFSLNVMHKAVEQLRVSVPKGFDIAEVDAPQLARWTITGPVDQRVLEVSLRQPMLGRVALRVLAYRNGPSEDWRWPALKPLDVDEHTSVVGLWLDPSLNVESLKSDKLLDVDTVLLSGLLDVSSYAPSEPAKESARGRFVSAFYAPSGDVNLSARVVPRPAGATYRQDLHWWLSDEGYRLTSLLVITARREARYELDVTLPADWIVELVGDGQDRPLPWRRLDAEPNTIRVQVAAGVQPDQPFPLNIRAKLTPPQWLETWTSKNVTLPQVTLKNAEPLRGEVLVEAIDDLNVEAQNLGQLVPVAMTRQANPPAVGPPSINAEFNVLAYRFEGALPTATFTVQRLAPRLTARSYSFYRVEPSAIRIHAEVVYQVDQARTRVLSFELPASTPETIQIRGLDNLRIKEYRSEVANGARRWIVDLDERRQGALRLAIDFEQSLATGGGEVSLPVPNVAQVSHYSGALAVEGTPDWEVRITSQLRSVDVGELAGADDQTGKHLVGAFGFAGTTPEVKLQITRQPQHGLPPVIVQQAHYTTLVGPNGASQTAAQFSLRSKVEFVQVDLPEGDGGPSTFLSADVNGDPIKPQRRGDQLLVQIKPSAVNLSTLRIVYESPVARVSRLGTVRLPGVRLLLPADQSKGEIPTANVVWEVVLPSGYRVVRSSGDLAADSEFHPGEMPALFQIAGWMTEPTYPTLGLPMAKKDLAFQKVGTQLQTAASDELNAASGFVPVDAVTSTEAKALQRQVESLSKLEIPKSEVRAPPAPKPAADAKPADMPPPVNAPVPAAAAAGPPATTAPVAAPGKPAPAQRELDRADDLSRGVVLGRANVLRRADALGFRTLPIQIEATGSAIRFQGFSNAPQVELTVVDEAPLARFGLAVALVLFVLGARLVQTRSRWRWPYIVLLLLGSTTVAIVWPEMSSQANLTFVAAMLLAVLGWIIAAVASLSFLVKLIIHRIRSRRVWAASSSALVAIAMLTGEATIAQEPLNPRTPVIVEAAEETTPLKVPADAEVWLYENPVGLQVPRAERVLVPYDRYVELWNRAFPQSPLDVKPPSEYSPAGATYTAELNGQQEFILRGELIYDVFVDHAVEAPLPLRHGVIAEATVDGQPARLKITAAEVAAADKVKRAGAVVSVLLEGKRRHTLALTVRFAVERQAGWHVISGHVPTHPATQLKLTVAQADTEVRTGDRRVPLPVRADKSLTTGLQAGHDLRIEWRAKAAEVQRDETLQAESDIIYVVQEDGVHVAWNLELQLRGAPRSEFRLSLPLDCRVEEVQSSNLRSWQSREANGRRELDITLLAPASGKETLRLGLSHNRALSTTAEELRLPELLVPDAAVHQGRVTVVRSGAVDLKTMATTGLSRADVTQINKTLQDGFLSSHRSPLGLVTHEAYRYSTARYDLRVMASLRQPQWTAQWHTVVAWATDGAAVDGRVTIQLGNQPCHRLQIALPNELVLESVVATVEHEWSVERVGERRHVIVRFPIGHTQPLSLTITGRISSAVEMPLPVFQLVEAKRQQTELAVETPSGYQVEPVELRSCKVAPSTLLNPWINPAKAPAVRLAIQSDEPDFAARVTVKKRLASVSGSTINNLRVTPRSVEETILFDYTISDSSIDELTFLMPARLRQATIHSPVSTARTIADSADRAGWVRVTLKFHDAISGGLRLLVEDSRPLGAETVDVQPPVLENCRVAGQYVVVENSGRSELQAQSFDGLEPLVQQQQDWGYVSRMLSSNPTEAYRVRPGATDAKLTTAVVQREELQTVAAQILLGQTVMVFDANGAYRATQTYSVDNKTEPYLVVELPEGATLWSALVAGEPVKPIADPADKSGRTLQVPLVRTSAGDLDYPVVLKYGGSVGRVRLLSPVSFPFLHTKNINVELSRVEIHLPERFRWYAFDGSMRRVVEQSEYESAFLSYYNKRVERLNQAFSKGDEFTKIRAFNNAQMLNENAPDLSKKREATVGLSPLDSVLKENVGEARGEMGDNRGALNKQYQSQSVIEVEEERGRRAGAGGAFGSTSQTQPQEKAAAQPNQPAFDKNWFEANGLNTGGKGQATQAGEKAEADGKGVNLKDATERRKSMAPKSGEAPQTPPPPAPKSMPPMGRPRAEDKLELRRNDPTVPQLKVAEPQQTQLEGAKKADALLDRYSMQQQRQLATDRDVDAPMRQSNFAEGQGIVRKNNEYEQVAVTTRGLASLDVDFPQRGDVIRFVTTRGDLKLQARAAPQRWIETLYKLGFFAAAALVGFVLWRVIRRPWARRLGDNLYVGVALLALGFVGLFTPLGNIALVLFIVGAVVLAQALRSLLVERLTADARA